ncbi:MAG: endonuclease NucS [Ghiorsea sp.]
MNNLEPFKEYLSERLSENSVNSYLSGIKHITKDYGSDILHITDVNEASKLKDVYGLTGSKRSVGEYGKGTARNAMNKYANFLEDQRNLSIADDLSIGQAGEDKSIESSQGFTYERDLHSTLEGQISELFPEHSLVGSEYSIEGVRLDLLLEKENELLVVELKAGLAKFAVFGQIAMYMGLIQEKFPEHSVSGVIIASDIHKGLEAACRTNPSISCQKYTMKLSLKKA